jgi:hypothetical protein
MEVGMAESLASFYIAILFLTVIGLVVLLNSLLSQGLRWTGRRVAAVWRGRDRAEDDPDGANLASPKPATR